MMSEPLSLRSRLVAMLVVLFLGGTVVLYFAAREYAGLAADRSFDRLLAGSAQSIAETLSVEEGAIRVDIPYPALDMLSAAPEDRVFYRIFGPDSKTITGYDDLPQWQAPRQSVRTVTFDEPQFYDAEYRGERVRFALLGREIAEPEVTGRIWVQVGQTRRARDTLAQELVLGAILPIGLMTVLAIVLVTLGIPRALRPLQRVGQDLAARRPEDLQPIAETVPSEMWPLVEAINGFMRRLSDSIETLRAFVADAAHQMRTPLAALRAQADVAKYEDSDGLRRSLAAVERNAARLSRLLDQLLSDATVTHRADVRRTENFDLLRLVRECISEVVPRNTDANIAVHSEAGEVMFRGDPLLVGEAFKNLIDNALKHGAGASPSVDIDVREHAGVFMISVADRGPGIAEADRDRVFERFARVDSRAAGAGLGLAIVRRAVIAHGGEIIVRDREGGGLCAEMRLRETREEGAS